jgi:hypothetical protein
VCKDELGLIKDYIYMYIHAYMHTYINTYIHSLAVLAVFGKQRAFSPVRRSV